MATRVGASEVTDVFRTSVLTTTQIERFIDTANLIVEKNLNTGDFAYTDAELIEIELFLACHFCALYEPRAQHVQVGDITETYQGKTGMRLDSTHYGQTAIMLDRFGVLSRLGKKRVSSLISVKQFASTDSRYIDHS